MKLVNNLGTTCQNLILECEVEDVEELKKLWIKKNVGLYAEEQRVAEEEQKDEKGKEVLQKTSLKKGLTTDFWLINNSFTAFKNGDLITERFARVDRQKRHRELLLRHFYPDVDTLTKSL